MHVSVQTSTQRARVLAILIAFLGTLVATILVAWQTSTLTRPLLSPGDAALYQVTDGSGKISLYALHVAQPGPFLYDTSSTGRLIQVEETLFDPATKEAMQSTIFYSRERGGLYVAGFANAYGGGSLRRRESRGTAAHGKSHLLDRSRLPLCPGGHP